MKRIVFLSDALYEGGAERYLLRLAGGLDRKVFEPAFLIPDRPELDHFAKVSGKTGIEVVRFGASRLSAIGNAITVRNALKRLRPDIAHLNLPSTYDLSCGAAALQARAAGARAVITTEHIVDILPSRRRAVLKRLSTRWIDRVIAISQKHRELLETRHAVPATKIRVILNGVEDPGLPEPRHNIVPRIVCVGSLEHRKGQDILIDAVAHLYRTGIRAELVLVGDGPDREILQNSLGADGLSSSVRFTGPLHSAWEEICAADIVAVPSRQEGIPFPLMEGMAAGAAIIAAALPGIDEVINDGRTGVLVPVGDRQAWAERLAGLVIDRDLRVRLGVEGRKEYEKRFTLARMVMETEGVYREVRA